MQAVCGSLTVISNGTPEEKALYPSLSPVGRRSLVMVYDVRATRMREDDYLAGSQLSEDIGSRGSGGVARNLFDSPAARELRDVLGGDDVQVGAIYPYNEAEAKKAMDITHRMDSAWAQTVDPDTNTIKLREWVAVTKCLHRILTYKAVPTVVAVVAKVNKIYGVELFINLLQKFSKSPKEKTLMYMTAIRTKYKDSDSKTILDYLDKLTDARNKLNGMSDEVFMVHVAEGLLGTELNDYIKHVMNTDGIELDTFMQGITDRANTVFGQKLLVQSSKTNVMHLPSVRRR